MLFIWLILQWMVLWSWVLGKAWGLRPWIYYLLLNCILVLQRVFWKSNVLKYDRFVFSGSVWSEQDNIRARDVFLLCTKNANFHRCFVRVCTHWKFVCLWNQWLMWDCWGMGDLLINNTSIWVWKHCKQRVFSLNNTNKTARAQKGIFNLKNGAKLTSWSNVEHFKGIYSHKIEKKNTCKHFF